MTTTKIWSHINVGDLCVHCGRSTAYGHSDMLFVDRIPADADLLDDDGNPIGDDFFHEDNVSN
jgi:hypothetical protein